LFDDEAKDPERPYEEFTTFLLRIIFSFMFNRGLMAASTAEAFTHTRDPLSQAGVLDIGGVAAVVFVVDAVAVAIIMFPFHEPGTRVSGGCYMVKGFDCFAFFCCEKLGVSSRKRDERSVEYTPYTRLS
jgi:hypothetical protein